MDFVFQGIQSTLPAWVYVVMLIGSVILSWWTYQHLHSISSFLRNLLIALRSSVFFILLLILLNPFYKAETSFLEDPKILVFLDNSESVTLNTGNYQGQSSYQQVLNQLNLGNPSGINYEIYAIGQQPVKTHPDSLTFLDSRTNLYDPMQIMKDLQDEISGSILISDGIFNQGRNPVFESESIDKPVLSIGLGDTTRQKDLIIKNVITNATGYIDTQHPLEVSVVNNGFANTSFEVQVLKNNEVLQRQTVTTKANNSTHTLNFEIPLREEGLRQFTVKIPALNEEWTTANNQQSFAVDILDQKQRILSLSFEVHPDVKFIRSLLISDNNTELSKRTWLGGSRFLEGAFNINADSLDLIVIQGLPQSGLPDNITNQINAILDKVPAVYMSTPGSNFRNFETLFDAPLPVIYSGTGNTEEAGFKPSVTSTEHPIMELPDVRFDRLPPIRATARTSTVSPGSVMLFESTYLGQNTGQPLVAVQELGNIRTALVGGYGWYRIALSSDAEQRDFVQKLFENIISWTSTKPDNRKLRVVPVKKIFTGGESIVLNGFLKNESGQMESNGTVNITLQGESIEERFYSMDNNGNGQYSLEIGALPQGIYQYKAIAQKGSRTIDSLEAEFSVSKSNTEFLSTVRNDRLLKQIAQNTGGSYFTFNNITGLADTLNKKGMLSKKEKVSETLFFPYQHSLWFIIVIALLGAEWIIRKYLALP